jgi:hypothetical protein
VGSTTAIEVRDRGTGIHGSPPAGSGGIIAARRPLMEIARVSSLPSTGTDSRRRPVMESVVTRIVDPSTILVVYRRVPSDDAKAS